MNVLGKREGAERERNIITNVVSQGENSAASSLVLLLTCLVASKDTRTQVRSHKSTFANKKLI